MTFINERVKKLNLKQRDATRNLRLVVLPEDVKNAKRRDATDCGFAMACKRADKSVKAVFFFKSRAYVEKKGELIRYVLPVSAQKEIVAFDRGGPFEPGEYQLTAPAPSGTLQAVRKRAKEMADQSRKGTGKSKSKHKRGHVHVTTGVRTFKDPSQPARRAKR